MLSLLIRAEPFAFVCAIISYQLLFFVLKVPLELHGDLALYDVEILPGNVLYESFLPYLVY